LLEMSPLSGDPVFKVFFADEKEDLTAMPTHNQTSYPARARPYTIETWLQKEKLADDIVVILDPDMVWMRPLSEHSGLADVRPGLMLAQRYDSGASWMHFKEAGEIAPTVSTDDVFTVYATGPPWALDVSDLRRMLPDWKRYTDAQKGDALMREQNAFNMAALKHGVPSSGSKDLMVSAPTAWAEAWTDPDSLKQPWSPYLLHYCQSYKYKGWEFHKSLFSDGWYAETFSNFLPSPISCGAALPESPPPAPTETEEPDVYARRNAFMISRLIPRLATAFKATRAKYCGAEDFSALGLMRPMQPDRCDDSKFGVTRYLVEHQSTHWDAVFPRGRSKCSKEAQQLPEHPAAVVRVAIDKHSHMQKLEVPEVALTEEDETTTDPKNPCSSLGCNSHKCAWASGGSIKRLVAKKACSNAVTVKGNMPAAALDANGQVPGGFNAGPVAIVTLRDCMHAVANDSCSGSFQMHKDTNECSCVPAGASCAETDNESICRFQILVQPTKGVAPA